MTDDRDICERLEDQSIDGAIFLRLNATKEIRALRHYVARLEGDLAVAENDLDDMRTYCKLQALDIITLGQEVGRLREALTMFTMFYPFGISLELDQAFRTARAALAEEEEEK